MLLSFSVFYYSERKEYAKLHKKVKLGRYMLLPRICKLLAWNKRGCDWYQERGEDKQPFSFCLFQILWIFLTFGSFAVSCVFFPTWKFFEICCKMNWINSTFQIGVHLWPPFRQIALWFLPERANGVTIYKCTKQKLSHTSHTSHFSQSHLIHLSSHIQHPPPQKTTKQHDMARHLINECFLSALGNCRKLKLRENENCGQLQENWSQSKTSKWMWLKKNCIEADSTQKQKAFALV